MSKEKGIAHIIVLFIILLVIGILVIIFLGIQASNALNLKLDQKTPYQNPFSNSSQYQNPFETYQNPFDEIKQ